MAEFITLEHFQATARHYHIYRIRKTTVDHQAHYHNYYQVCYVVSGEIIHRQDHDAVTLSAGDAFIVPPGFTHSLHFNNERTEMYSLAFEETLFAAGFPQTGGYQFLKDLQPGSPLPVENSVRLRVTLDRGQRKVMENLLECLVQQQQTPCPAGLSAAPSLTAAIIYTLAQNYYNQPQNTLELSKLSGYDSTLQQCVAYIDLHFKEQVTLSDLSKRFGVSRSSFCAIFPQFSGMPLRKYIANKRVKEAQALIRTDPEKSISQVAAEVGYNDDSTFYRNFLQITGISPGKYKQLFTKKAE